MKVKLFLGSLGAFLVLFSTCVFASVADGAQEQLSPLVTWVIRGAVVFVIGLFAIICNAFFFIKGPNDNRK